MLRRHFERGSLSSTSCSKALHTEVPGEALRISPQALYICLYRWKHQWPLSLSHGVYTKAEDFGGTVVSSDSFYMLHIILEVQLKLNYSGCRIFNEKSAYLGNFHTQRLLPDGRINQCKHEEGSPQEVIISPHQRFNAYEWNNAGSSELQVCLVSPTPAFSA